jgi:transposase
LPGSAGALCSLAEAAGGRPTLASKGAGGARCRLSPAQLRELEAVLDAGKAAWGWDEDQCWTLARIAEQVRRRFGVGYTLAGLDLLPHRIGWSVQVPVRQAAYPDSSAHIWATVSAGHQDFLAFFLPMLG